MPQYPNSPDTLIPEYPKPYYPHTAISQYPISPEDPNPRRSGDDRVREWEDAGRSLDGPEIPHRQAAGPDGRELGVLGFGLYKAVGFFLDEGLL